MSDKRARGEALIAKYRWEAAARRKLGNVKGLTTTTLAVQPENGVFTVRFGNDAKPLSALGGVVKTLGHSRIDIPEMKWRRG